MPLKLPDRVTEISLDDTLLPGGIPGFLPFAEHALGNGDSYGLYWPVGQEGREPIVVETFHDEGRLVPAFSSLDTFLAASHALEDDDGYLEHADFSADPHAPRAACEQARLLVKQQAVDAAVALLERTLQRLPEYADASALLVSQYRRLERHDDACRLAVRTLLAPPCFGSGPTVERIWTWLASQADGPADLADDPLWQHRAAFAAIPCGGSKYNDLYPVIDAVIAAYVERGDTPSALLLLQAQAQYLGGETLSLQQRYGFEREAQWARQISLSAILANGPRHL
ncbi:hypothetical protein SAMN05216588_103214 [Pseudomonas flavescens]|uniref:Tetratricopeptide repeat-containing protein n=1 Tax=Phytopseudomonas flavescens TaxID=29435 RepID=A0A1G8ALA3_9GAMM|nr:hypothetical protein [Pseudomonas flavescens]SDH21718.1 hypothetical protein SAMN05216588_103214 [Pseudomonas flavescens]